MDDPVLKPYRDRLDRLDDEIVDRFVAFAENADPNVEGKEKWSPYRSKKDILRWE